MFRFYTLLVPLLFTVVACGGESAPVSSQGSDAAVLELSISVASASSLLVPTLADNVLPKIDEQELLTLSAFGDVASSASPTFEQGHLELLGVRTLWQQSRGDGVVVAVIDSGVDVYHAALQDAVLPGYDFVLDTPVMQDPSGHGTAVAALIAGRGPQWGLAPAAHILPLRVLDAHNLGASGDLARAILYAADLLPDLPNTFRADIINLSLGGYGYSAEVDQAIRAARAAGLVILAAAGNNGQDRIAFPANLPEVLSVGAADLKQGVWTMTPYSNYGVALDMVAPLGGLSLTNRGNYAEAGVLSAKANTPGASSWFHGTSYAVAEASGLAALLVAAGAHDSEARLRLSVSRVVAKSESTADGLRVLNPLAALNSLQEGTDGKIIVQVLDANSLQEIVRFRGQLTQHIELAAGDYRLLVWQDNDDGLWQIGEPNYRSVAGFRVEAGERQARAIVLR